MQMPASQSSPVWQSESLLHCVLPCTGRMQAASNVAAIGMVPSDDGVGEQWTVVVVHVFGLNSSRTAVINERALSHVVPGSASSTRAPGLVEAVQSEP